MIKKNKLPFILGFGILIVWGLYRYFFRFPEWVDELIFKNVIMLFPMLFVVKFLERRSLASVGFSNKNFLRNFLIGLGIGIFLVIEEVLSWRVRNGSTIFNPNNLSGYTLLLNIFLPFITSFIEETVYRGYLLNRLLKMYNSQVIAVGISTVFFVAAHIPLFIFILHYSSHDLLIGSILLIELSIVNSIIFLYTKTITASTVTHGIWNLSSVLLK